MQIMEHQKIKDIEKLEKQALNDERLKEVKIIQYFYLF